MLLIAVLSAPYAINAEVKSSPVKIEFWTPKPQIVSNDQKYFPAVAADFDKDVSNSMAKANNQPQTLIGTWTSEGNDFKYDEDKDRYYIENFLGCEGTTLEFSVGKEKTKDINVTSSWFNPVRYDFNVYFETKSTATTGLKYADLCEGSIRPFSKTKNSFTIWGNNGEYAKEDAPIPAKFVTPDGESFYQLNAGYAEGSAYYNYGLALYATFPQSLGEATKPGAGTPGAGGTENGTGTSRAGTGGTGTGTGTGSESASSLQTSNSYVTKDGDTYTVYIVLSYTSCYQRAYKDGDLDAFSTKMGWRDVMDELAQLDENGNIKYEGNYPKIDPAKWAVWTADEERQRKEYYKLAENFEPKAHFLKFTFNKDLKALPDQSGIEDIDVDNANAPVEYFNLQGVRVENPAASLYIRRQGTKVEKVYLR